MFNLDQDEFFDFETFKRIMVNHNIFTNRFHGVNLVIFLVLNQVNFAECASANQLKDFEIVEDKFLHIVSIVWFLISTIDSCRVGCWRWHILNIFSVHA